MSLWAALMPPSRPCHSPDLSLRGRPPSKRHPPRTAYRHAIGHEQDQGSCDVDGKEGVWGSFEVLPLTAAEQVLVSWMRRKNTAGPQPLPPTLPAQELWLAVTRALVEQGTTFCLPLSLASNHLLGEAPVHVSPGGSKAQRGQITCPRSHWWH